MEDAIKHPREAGDYVGEPEVDVAANEVTNDGENLHSDDGNNSENVGGGDSDGNKSENVIEPNDALCSGGETMKPKDMNEGTNGSGSMSEEPTADKGATEKQTDISLEPEIGEVKDLEDGAGRSDPKEESVQMNTAPGEVSLDDDGEMEDAANTNPVNAAKDVLQEQMEVFSATVENSDNIKSAAKHNGDGQDKAASPNSRVRNSPSAARDQPMRTIHTHETLPLMPEDDDGSPEEQAAFMNEVESFYRQKGMDFKPPRFYQQPLNCLKLWRAVIRLGGYEKVTGCKLWRQVGESFRPPKTCTTVSWTFRIFFEKALLEYEKYQIQIGALQFPSATPTEAPALLQKEGNGHHGSETGRARRDAAARAMQGWHSQRHSSNGEIEEPVIKSKNINSMSKREKNLKSIGLNPLKQKRPNDLETSNKVPRTEIPEHLVASVVDIGPPADWVKINVRQTVDCFEVYALVPGLIREEVRVQSDPAGRLVITGQPEQLDNPWGVTPFKKVVTLPARIDPLHTSAVVSLHGGLFVRVPFEQQS